MGGPAAGGSRGRGAGRTRRARAAAPAGPGRGCRGPAWVGELARTRPRRGDRPRTGAGPYAGQADRARGRGSRPEPGRGPDPRRGGRHRHAGGCRSPGPRLPAPVRRPHGWPGRHRGRTSRRAGTSGPTLTHPAEMQWNRVPAAVPWAIMRRRTMNRRDAHLDAMLRHLGAAYYDSLHGRAARTDVRRAVDSVAEHLDEKPVDHPAQARPAATGRGGADKAHRHGPPPAPWAFPAEPCTSARYNTDPRSSRSTGLFKLKVWYIVAFWVLK